jgi:hypothetical protein
MTAVKMTIKISYPCKIIPNSMNQLPVLQKSIRFYSFHGGSNIKNLLGRVKPRRPCVFQGRRYRESLARRIEPFFLLQVLHMVAAGGFELDSFRATYRKIMRISLSLAPGWLTSRFPSPGCCVITRTVYFQYLN